MTQGQAAGDSTKDIQPPQPIPLIAKRLTALLALSQVAAVALASEGPNASAATEYFEPLPVVLTPSRLPQPLREAPASVTVIDGDFIRATGYRDLARIFRLVPGMQVGQERGGTQWVTYHGLGNDIPAEMQVLIDGRAVYSPTTFGGVDWLSLPLVIDEIERIEIVRGTDSVAYGPNAFLGVINIITRNAGDVPGATGTVNVGDAGIRDLRVLWNSKPDTHALRLAAASRVDNGFEDLFDNSRMNTFSLRSDHRLSDVDQVTVRLAGSEGSRQAGYWDSTFQNNGERTTDTRAMTAHLQWRHAPTADQEWLVNLFRNEMKGREEWMAVGPRNDLAPPRFAYVPLDRNRRTVRDSLEIQHRALLTPATHIVWGGEVREERMNSPFLFHGRDGFATSLKRLFGNLELRLAPAWTANVGTMAEKYSDDRSRLSPRAFVNWQASGDSTLRVGYSQAWRDRNVFERYGDVRVIDPVDNRVLVRPYVQNLDLKPPHIDSFEVGWLTRFKPADTRLDARLFCEHIHDFAVRREAPATPDNPLYASLMPPTQYLNLASKVVLRGIEYQIDTKPTSGTRILFSHTVIDRRIDDPRVKARVAPYTASLSWLQHWGGKESGWSSMASALRMGPLAGGDGFVPSYDYVAPAYTTFDASLRRRFKLGEEEATVALSAINLGPRHQEIADRSEQRLHPEGPVNRASRMVFLSLSIGTR